MSARRCAVTSHGGESKLLTLGTSSRHTLILYRTTPPHA